MARRVGVCAIFLGALSLFVWSVGDIKTLPAFAQVGAGYPSCTLASNPVVGTGSTIKLFYEVEELPTVLTIVADDPGATPSATPTVGAPDPTRADKRQTGSVVSGPVTKNTIFTMTATNARGSGTCTTRIYFKARPSAGWKVPLVRQQPVFTRFQIPGGFDTTFGAWPFTTSYWIPGGYFVVNGPGNSGAGLSSSPAPYRTAKNVFEAGGMYLLKEDGTFIGARDVVFDSSRRAFACFEGAGCTAGPFIHSFGNNKFVRELQPRGFGFVRGPIVYTVGGSGITMDQRLFYNERGWGNDSEENDTVGRLESFSRIAVAGGKMIGVAQRYAGWFPVGSQEQGVPGGPRPRISLHNEVYDVNLNKLATFSNPAPTRQPGQNYSGAPPTTVPLFYPIIGVGAYVVAATNQPGYLGAFPPIQVYKMPSTNDLAQRVAPSLVQTLFTNRYLLHYAIDTANQNRLAIFSIPSGTAIGVAQLTMTIYQAGTSSLTQVSERNLGPDAAKVSGLFMNGSAFAVSGDYLAYGSCGNVTNWDGGRGGHKFNGCELIVEKIQNGERLTVEPLPLSRLSDFGIDGLGALVGEAQAIGSVAISPTGRILVTTGAGPNSSGGDNGNAYLYQIGGVSAPPPGGGGGGGTTTLGQQNLSEGLRERFGKFNAVSFQLSRLAKLLEKFGIIIPGQ